MMMSRSNIALLLAILFLFPIASAFAQRVVVIGDSNSAIEDNWTNYLKDELPGLELVNLSVSGNTIGFDNLGQKSLNTLTNLSSYLNEARRTFNDSVPDVIVFLLGTNDCKQIFHGQKDTVHQNFLTLLGETENFFPDPIKPRVLVVSPPPQAPLPSLAEKYRDGDACAEELTEFYRRITSEKQMDFLDIYHTLKPVFEFITPDGIHLDREGQILLSRIIASRIRTMTI